MTCFGRIPIATLFSAALATAATIGPCTNCWLPFNPTTIVDSSAVPTNPYFVNQSQDGPKQSLAYQLNQYLPLQYQSSGSAPPNDAPAGFYFNNPSGATLQAQFLQSTTSDSLQLGWYDVHNPANLNPLFTRSGSAFQPTVVPSGTVTFTPSAQFGFYVKYMNVGIPGNICAAIGSASPGSTLFAGGTSQCYDPAKVPLLTTNQIVYTQSNLDSTGPNTETSFEQTVAQIPSTLSSYHQHFVALQNTNTGVYYIGMEDAFGRDPNLDRFMGVYEGNGDYQDFVIALSPGPIAPTGIISVTGSTGSTGSSGSSGSSGTHGTTGWSGMTVTTGVSGMPESSNTSDMPEPASFALVGLGVAAIAALRTLRRAK